MQRNEVTVLFSHDIETVWGVLSDIKKYPEWCTSIKKLEPGADDDHFRIHLVSKLKIKSDCVVTENIPPRQFRIYFENNRYSGDRSFILRKQEDGGTKMHYVESLVISNPVTDMLSFLYTNMDKRQSQFIRDLKRRLSESADKDSLYKQAELMDPYRK